MNRATGHHHHHAGHGPAITPSTAAHTTATAGAAAPVAGDGLLQSLAGNPGGLAAMWVGWQSIFYREILRFWKVRLQTIAAPALSAVLYLLIFRQVLEGRLVVYGEINYTAFLAPGLVMMSILQNAFANSSSSLVQSKVMGGIVFLLLSPLSPWAWFVGYVSAAMVRGLVVGLGVYLATLVYVPPVVAQPLWALVFALLGAALMGTFGLIAGLWVDKFDQMATFQNFLIMPMTFLAGVFYSIHSLPPVWQKISHLNPFFYMIDGFRYGFFGQGDVSPWLSLAVVVGFWLALSALALRWLYTGYKMRP